MKISMHVSGRKQFGHNFGKVAGTTYQKGMPISARVKVFSRHNVNAFADLISNSNGSYSLYLPVFKSYTIQALNLKSQFNAVIQDNVVPK